MKAFAVISVSIAIATGALLTAGCANAGVFHKFKQYQAYDQFWSLKNPGGPVELNPQPLPPGEFVSINPQPLPPRYLFNAQLGLGNPGAEVGFNPQPDPPGYQ